MDPAQLVLAFSAGALAFLSPCCLPMFVGYITHYVGSDEGGRILTGLVFSASTVSGFLLVFVGVGGASTLLFRDTLRWAWTTLPAIGVLMVALGVVTGWTSLLDRLPHIPLPIWGVRSSSFLYGLAYGVSAIGCSLPVFLLVVVQSAALGGNGDIVWLFVSYGAGAAALMMPLTVSLSLAKSLVRERLVAFVPHVKKAEGIILVLAGAYMIYYYLTL